MVFLPLIWINTLVWGLGTLAIHNTYVNIRPSCQLLPLSNCLTTPTSGLRLAACSMALLDSGSRKSLWVACIARPAR